MAENNARQTVHAYTPGLRVTEHTVLTKVRRLPLPGEVHVEVGDIVQATDIVASTHLPGRVHSLNVADEMNCQPGEIAKFMLKDVGEDVSHGEILAESKSLWGLLHRYIQAPIAGTIESISTMTGQVLFRGEPIPVELDAYVDGTIEEVFSNEGVTIHSECALVQGIFGIGGERYGKLKLLVGGPDDIIDGDCIEGEECRGCVVVGGSLMTLGAIEKAIAAGASGIVAGGIESEDLDRFMGEPIGVAVTGQENIPLTVIVTEGFGRLAMADRTFEIFRALSGQRASISGATQIRAGVIRPEIIVSRGAPAEDANSDQMAAMMSAGSTVRLIRAPYFGILAEVVELPPAPVVIETEAKVRVLKARLPNGSVVTVPRSNVELIME